MSKLKLSKIISKTKKEEKIEMLDFEVEGNHNYFVDGILSHNSEHVPFLCVAHDSRINIEQTSKRARAVVTARQAHDMFHKGKVVRFLSMDFKKGTMSYQPVLRAEKTMSKKITISITYVSFANKGTTYAKLVVGHRHPVYVIGKGYVPASRLKKEDKVIFFKRPKFTQFTPASKPRAKLYDNYGDDFIMKQCKWCPSKFKTSVNSRLTHCKKGVCNNLQKLKYRTGVVTDTEKSNEVIEMYDFTVANNHNFLCNGVLVKNCLDEIDLIQDPRVLEEAALIPCTYGKYYPLTVYLSTRKFAGGNMEQKLKSVPKAGGEVLRWNILDVTERISREDARADEPRVTKYISVNLPMETLTPEEYDNLPKESKNKYERIEAYAGIAEHPMLPVMKNMLVDRPQGDVSEVRQEKTGAVTSLYKTLIAVHNNFKGVKPAMGEAQLLCNSPSSANLVYSRFNQDNIISLVDCYEMITGNRPEIVSYELILYELKALGLPIYGGADWGFTDFTTLTIFTILPDGKVVSLYNEMAQFLEIDDIVEKVLAIQEVFDIKAWYPDQNYPAYLKTLNRKCGKKWKKFTKDVVGGISALQTKIVNSSNRRSFFVLDVPHNEFFAGAFGLYKWAKDGKGNIIDGTPYHDSEGVSDVMDAIRYPMQVLCGSKKKPIRMTVGLEKPKNNTAVNQSIMRAKIQELTGDPTAGMEKSKVKKFIVT